MSRLFRIFDQQRTSELHPPEWRSFSLKRCFSHQLHLSDGLPCIGVGRTWEGTDDFMCTDTHNNNGEKAISSGSDILTTAAGWCLSEGFHLQVCCVIFVTFQLIFT